LTEAAWTQHPGTLRDDKRFHYAWEAVLDLESSFDRHGRTRGRFEPAGGCTNGNPALVVRHVRELPLRVVVRDDPRHADRGARFDVLRFDLGEQRLNAGGSAGRILATRLRATRSGRHDQRAEDESAEKIALARPVGGRRKKLHSTDGVAVSRIIGATG
jgi:hypothetical protein